MLSANLLSISAYYESAANKDVAKRVLQRIVRSATSLIDNPYLGHPSESTDGMHELQVARLPYFLPYRVVDDRIESCGSFTNRKSGRPHGNRMMMHLKTP